MWKRVSSKPPIVTNALCKLVLPLPNLYMRLQSIALALRVLSTLLKSKKNGNKSPETFIVGYGTCAKEGNGTNIVPQSVVARVEVSLIQ